MSSIPATAPRAYVNNNRFADPWSKFETLMYSLVLTMAFPALTLLVFIRPKLGFRVPRPWQLMTLFLHLLTIVISLNCILFGYSLIRDLTPFGDWVQQMRQIHRQAKLAEKGKTPPAEPVYPPEGYDAPLPAEWRDYGYGQQQNWRRQHRITDPVKLQQQQQDIKRRHEEADRKRKEEAEAAKLEAHPPFFPHLSLFFFSVAMLATGFYRRYQGRKLIGQNWHTVSRGESYLSPFLPNISEFAIQAYIEPAILFLLAIPYAWISISTSLWVMYAAVCVSISEVMVMEIAINRVLDQYDSEVEARQMQESRQLLREKAKQQRVRDGHGVRGVVFPDDIQAALDNLQLTGG